jgi:hypothetical protein
LGSSIEFVDRTFFETREPGVSEIRLMTAPGKFGGAPPAIKQKPVEVLLIDVSVDPADARMDPNETASFTATVTNANDDKVKWTVPAGLTEVSQSNFGRTITVKTPNTPWSPPFALLARSQAETGSRADGKKDSDPREGGAVISIKGRGITVSPRSVCLNNSDKQPFTAEVVGVENPVIKWSLEGWGRIDENTGVYTAPDIGTTDDIIIAEVVGDTLEGYAYVRVGACVCSFDIAVGGASTWAAGGPDVAHQFVGPSPEEGIITWFFLIPNGPGGVPDNGLFSANVWAEPGKAVPQPGDVGGWRMNAVYSNGTQSWTITQVDSMASMTLHVDEMTSTFIRGSMVGEAVQRNDPKDRERITSRVFITVNFRSGLLDGGWPCVASPEESTRKSAAAREQQKHSPLEGLSRRVK